jgi:hypothetical protein
MQQRFEGGRSLTKVHERSPERSQPVSIQSNARSENDSAIEWGRALVEAHQRRYTDSASSQHICLDERGCVCE